MISLNKEPLRIVLPGLLNIFISATPPEKELVILKLDFEKAFDKIEHKAMTEIMKHMGFGDKWIY
jgi:hypothetical protein